MLKIKILTAYPEMFPTNLKFSLIGKALNEKKFSIETINLHDFGIDDYLPIIKKTSLFWYHVYFENILHILSFGVIF